MLYDFNAFRPKDSKAIFACGSEQQDVKFFPTQLYMTGNGSNLFALNTGFSKPTYYALLDVDETSMSYFMIGDTCKRTIFIFSLTDSLEPDTLTNLLKLASLMGYDADASSITRRDTQEKSCNVLPAPNQIKGEIVLKKEEEVAKKKKQVGEKIEETKKVKEKKIKAFAEKAIRESKPDFDITLPNVIPKDLDLLKDILDADAFSEELSLGDNSNKFIFILIDTRKSIAELLALIPKEDQGRADDKINCPKFCKSCTTSTNCDQC